MVLVGRGGRRHDGDRHVVVGPPRRSLAGRGEGALDSPEGGAILLIVADDRAGLEADIAAGRLVCPRCGRGVLGGWGCARRRPVRTLEGVRWLRPRRGRCRDEACGATHVLLPDMCLLRRCDAVEVIGAAVLAATDAGYGGSLSSSAGRRRRSGIGCRGSVLGLSWSRRISGGGRERLTARWCSAWRTR